MWYSDMEAYIWLVVWYRILHVILFLDKFRTLMWSMSATSSVDQWQYANIPIGSPSAYRLVFQSDQGRSGILALDDITLTSGCTDGGK